MTTPKTSQVILVGGIKGGVGKSLVSRAFVDYMIEHDYPYFLVDADSEIRDVKKYYPEAQVLAFSDDPKRMLEPDWIVRQAIAHPDHTLIVNLPGNGYEPLKQWLQVQMPQMTQPVEDGQPQLTPDLAASLKAELGFPQFVHLFVTDGSWSSTQMFRKSIRDLGDRIPHVLVRNNGANRSASGWDHVNENLPGLAEMLEEFHVLDMEFPDIYAPILFQIDMQVDLVRDKDNNPLKDENGRNQYYWDDDTDRPPSQGYRFKDAIDHEDRMIGRRFYTLLPQIYGFFDDLFSKSPYLSPLEAVTVEASKSSSTSKSSKKAKTKDASSSELTVNELPKELQASVEKLAQDVSTDVMRVMNAIAQLPRTGDQLRKSFGAYLHLKLSDVPESISEELLRQTRDGYMRAVETKVAA